MLASKAINFRQIFGFADEDNEISGVIIPIIQRDYAQGRASAVIIRSRFLQVLYEALAEGRKTTLDFIYGNVENGSLIPLDGQQRLTTLFLLHYYIAQHENIPEDEWKFMFGFSYETRASSREFCKHLLGFTPDFNKRVLAEQIKDEAWFLMEWESDPTVLSMLVMLDAIHEKFARTENLWECLMGDSITFYFLPLKDIDATDELYIKMNSRGKALTAFENWKAELELSLKDLKLEGDVELPARIAKKIDLQWTDMLWPFRNSNTGNAQDDMVTDDEFLRYIRFISDLIGYQQGETEVITNELSIIEQRFSKNCTTALENVKRLEHLFDIWANEKDIDLLFDKYISKGHHEEGKILLELPSEKWSVNLFRECCKYYGKQQGKRPAFSLGHFLLLYAFILFLEHRQDINDTFPFRLRTLNNLIKNSSDTIRVENMQALLSQTEDIIVRGIVDVVNTIFQTRQTREENLKLEWVKSNSDLTETLFRLEDHKYLNGFVCAVAGEKLEYVEWCSRFESLFSCDRDLNLVCSALLTKGDCFEKDGSWRYQIGIGGHDKDQRVIDRLWRELFSPIRLQENMLNSLHALLEEESEFTDEKLERIINDYVQHMEQKNEYLLPYYLVKYPSMRKNRYSAYNNFGKYYWRRHADWNNGDNDRQKDYNVILMTTEWQLSGFNYDIFLKAIYESLKGEGSYLEIGDHSFSNYNSNKKYGDGIHIHSKQGYQYYLTLSDNKFHVYLEAGEGKEVSLTELETVEIEQNEHGVDTQDRVKIGKGLVKKYLENQDQNDKIS